MYDCVNSYEVCVQCITGSQVYYSDINMLLFLLDVNECWRHPGRLCAQTCENTVGSYRCSCTTGFSLTSDGKNCEGTSTLYNINTHI